MGKRVYQGQPYKVGNVLIRVEFITALWTVLSRNITEDKTDFYLVETSELQVGNINLSQAKAALHGFGKEVDLFNIISAYESLSTGTLEFQDIIGEGFYNLKHLADLPSFIRYSYVDCANNRGILSSVLAHSELMTAYKAPTYQWTTPQVNQLLSDFVVAEQSNEPAVQAKFLKQYLVLRSRDVNDVTEVEPTFKMLPLSTKYPTLGSFQSTYGDIVIYGGEPEEELDDDPSKVSWSKIREQDVDGRLKGSSGYWVIDSTSDSVVAAVIYDYSNFIDTIEHVVIALEETVDDTEGME